MPAIETSAKQATNTYVMFNNCHGARAVRNAERMKVMLREGVSDYHSE